jgi:hypothetical protein
VGEAKRQRSQLADATTAATLASPLVNRRMKKLSVIIPSRTQVHQGVFLERALRSIFTQTQLPPDLALETIVGLDAGAVPPPSAARDPRVRIVESGGRSQAAALNAAARKLDGEYVAFLEDDDQWHAQRLAISVPALADAKFLSCTQLEINTAAEVIRVNDFATPSGWFMPMATWERVGLFNETYRYHLDNEWLGRLAESGLKRFHLVEATAPVHVAVASQVRPWLARVVQLGGANSHLARHALAVPLVQRLVHARSGMAQIAMNPEQARASQAEMATLAQRFGRLPW